MHDNTFSLGDIQVLLERAGTADGATRYARAVSKQDTSDLPPGISATKTLLPQVADGIRLYISEVMTGKSNRNASYVKFLEVLPAETLAFLTLKFLLNKSGEKKNTVCEALGLAIEDEMNMAAFKNGAKGLFDFMVEKLKHKHDRWYKRTVLIHAQRHSKKSLKVENPDGTYEYKITNKDIDRIGFTEITRRRIGQILIEIACQTTGYFHIHTYLENVKGKSRRIDRIVLDEELVRFISEKHNELSFARPVYPPMVVPPKPWYDAVGGGYLTRSLQLKLIKGVDEKMIQRWIDDGRLDKAMRDLNTLQAVPLAINKNVLNVVNELWESNLLQNIDEETYPDREFKPEPERPAEWIADPKGWPLTHPVEFKDWKRKATAVHEWNKSMDRTGMIKDVSMKLRIASEYSAYDRIYFPHQYDSRGRAYPVVNFLNRQGDDLCKGLLTRAEGKPINEDSAVWLAVHGANCWAVKDEAGIGLDKKSYTDRYEWVKSNEDKILRVAADPIGFNWWMDADTPIQFLAFCYEWAGWIANGPGFVSTLPLGADGSCNGLQHYAALQLDKSMGELVNLVPSDKPADLYTVVADKAAQIVVQQAVSGSNTEQAKKLQGKMNRKLVKRAVMTTPYGVTRYGIKEQLVGDKKLRPIFQYVNTKKNRVDIDRPMVAYAAAVIDEALADEVKNPRDAMKFLGDLAKIAADQGKALNWTTPDGFPIYQFYSKMEIHVIRTVLSGGLKTKTVSLETATPTGKLNVRKQVQAVAPNYVHSLDACHLRMTANALADRGIQITAIHDSYESLAADFQEMQEVIRDQFVKLHSEVLLARFRDEVASSLDMSKVKQLPEVPMVGDLDIESVANSDYFFA